MPTIVSALSKDWTVMVRLDAVVVGSNTTRGMDVCVQLFNVLSCVGKERLCDGPIAV
jgi:hypothetical protein